MLVLGVRESEVIQIGTDIRIIVSSKDGKLRVCIEAPDEVKIRRKPRVDKHRKTVFS